MKTILRDGNGGMCSKKLLAVIFGFAAVAAAFVPYTSDTVVITFATLALGNNGLTTAFFSSDRSKSSPQPQ